MIVIYSNESFRQPLYETYDVPFCDFVGCGGTLARNDFWAVRGDEAISIRVFANRDFVRRDTEFEVVESRGLPDCINFKPLG